MRRSFSSPQPNCRPATWDGFTPTVDRYKALEEAQQDEFKKGLRSWVNLYAFLSQIMPFQEIEFEKFYAFAKLLSNIIKILNERFATDFTDADRLFFEQIEQELVEDEKLQHQARNNSLDNFKYGFKEIFLAKLIERMEDNQEIFERILDDKAFGDKVRELRLRKVYRRINEAG